MYVGQSHAIFLATLHMQHKHNDIMSMSLTEVWHIAHFWVSYGRCAMFGLPMGWSEGLSR